MFDSLTDKALRAAHLLHGNHRAPRLDPDAIKPDTLRADITVEPANRRTPARPAVGGTPTAA
jgi:hypothetical protein